MKFSEMDLPGAFLIDLDRIGDDRGYFARSFCEEEFGTHGLPTRFVQCNLSLNRSRGTLRGLHYQAMPQPEGKLVRCVRGAVYDVGVDLRTGSPTYGRWLGLELSAENGRALYLPPGFAHGFQTLEDTSELLYHMTEPYQPELARGAFWNDPAFGIFWPMAVFSISERDAAFVPMAQRREPISDAGTYP